MLPPEETNYDIVVQNSVTPSANVVWNPGQYDLRYSNVWCDKIACNNLVFHDNGEEVGAFSGNYNELRDNLTINEGGGAPEYYETHYFFPDKTLNLTAV